MFIENKLILFLFFFIKYKELQRFFGSKFFEWDLELYDEKTDQRPKANSSDLNEDLGQVEYLFSDKTGTLTENEMIFKQCYIDHDVYEESNNKLVHAETSHKADFKVKNLDFPPNSSLIPSNNLRLFLKIQN